MIELREPHKIDTLLVTGSVSREITYKLGGGKKHQEDAVLNAHAVEQTIGGAGVCNAFALERTGLAENISLHTVLGSENERLDTDAQFIIESLSDKNIHLDAQLLEGSTEKTVIFLSGTDGDPKRGFRLTDHDGIVLREKFNTKKLRRSLIENPLVVASSFEPEKIAELASIHTVLQGEDGVFVWTINDETAQHINSDRYIQEILKRGAVDILCMSESEKATIESEQSAQDFLQGVSIQLITNGRNGCTIIDNREEIYSIPAFDRVNEVINDNGAGEAHHANFLATYFACTRVMQTHTDPRLRARVLQTAGSIANLAGYLKVQQPDSLWFPSIDYNLVFNDIMQNKYTPQDIARRAYMVHENNSIHSNGIVQ
jgi:sugar/nucleoside kinase (ribokinase family)